MSTRADRGIAILRTNYDDLAGKVRAFSDTDLGRLSGSREWTIAQVLSHLGSGSEIMRANLEATAAGSPQPEPDFNQSVWARWNAMSPREQADGYLASVEQLMLAFEGLDDAARDSVRIQLGFLPEPVDLATFAGLRLIEVALHSWDVRVVDDPDAGLTAEEADYTLDLLTGPLSFLVGFLAKPDQAGVAEVRVRVETTDPARSIDVTLAPATSVGEVTDGADGVLSGPAEAVVRLLYGRLDTVRTPDAVTLESDTLTLDQVKRVFPGF